MALAGLPYTKASRDETITGNWTFSGTVTLSSTITISGLTASRAMATGASKEIVSSATTATELGYVNGVTSAIQTQIDGKQPLDAELTAIAGLTSAADKGIQFTGSGTAGTFDLTTAAKTVLDDATVAAMVDTLGGASSTGTGGLVRATSPTLVTPALGTPSSGNLGSCTAYPGDSSLVTTGTVTSGTWDSAYEVVVEENTAGVGSPNVLTAAESGKVLTNEGASAKNYHTLPTAAAGLVFEFYVVDTDGIRIVAAASDVIRVGANVSIAAGYLESTTIGDTVRLVARDEVEWYAAPCVGTWSLETS